MLHGCLGNSLGGRATISSRHYWQLPQWQGASLLPRSSQQHHHHQHHLRHCQQQHARCIFAKASKGLSELLNLNADKDRRTRVTQGRVSPELEVPAHIPRPPYAATYDNPGWNQSLMIHTKEELPRMRAACQLAARVLQAAGKLVKPGVTTDEIDRLVHQMAIDAGAYPSPLRYGKFPKSVCTSINEVICHGIPDSRPLEDGDIVNIDVTVYLNGYHGDTSRMFPCGDVDQESLHLMSATERCLEAGIAVCGPDVPIKQIGDACGKSAKQSKLKPIADFCGHGVGTVFHAGPVVMHVRNNERGTMKVGQTFTIEPILCTGNSRFKTWSDKWTAVTVDGSRSAQYEHTILITPNGHEILTLP